MTYGYRVKDNELVKLKYGLICAAMDTVLTLQTNKREWGEGEEEEQRVCLSKGRGMRRENMIDR